MDETTQAKPIETTLESKKIEDLTNIIQNYEFFSNQVAFNIQVHQGLRLILEKLAKIEEKLENGNK